MKTDDLREKFLIFFKNKGHKVFPSDSLVPADPSVLFTSAGMNQFKPYFLGEKKDVKRATSCQKCLRTDDLDKVGKTAYHHTFFEMLGNFSFGDYFKKEAIEFAWEFLIRELNLKADDLWVSVYIEDEEAYKIWRDFIGVSTEKIVKLGMDKNFWPANAPTQGPDGPCGPCSEIFFDKGKDYGCKKENCSPACECGRFVEIWNLVFTQYNRKGDKLEPLRQKNIDTGMGLERMSSVLQGKSTNFEIDIILPVVEFVKELLSMKDASYISFVNAIVDHVRAATFAIADGVFPSNEERGYIVRKLIRKASYYGFMLNKKKPFLYKVVPLCAEFMKKPYPDVYEKKEMIASIVLTEEERFLNTLKTGRDRFFVVAKEAKAKDGIIKGEEIFKLYDTYGFPLEIVKELASSSGLKIDEAGFLRLLEQQRRISKERSKFSEGIFQTKDICVDYSTEFIGYDTFSAEVEVVKIFKETEEVDSLKEDEEGTLILKKTIFYPEGGGQLCDKGVIDTFCGKFYVEYVYKVGETIFHKGKVKEGSISVGEAKAVIDEGRRRGLMRAHTATHLLQAALRRILGEHVIQQGSLVDVDRLRFDFTHFQSLSESEIKKIESMVNEFILRKDKVEKKIVSFQQAKEEKALAFFDEKYRDYVRMVSIGDYSKELCGGTHVDNTSEIGSFYIVSESSISSGIRRIEAIVGILAYEKAYLYKQSIKSISSLLKVKEDEVFKKVKGLLEELKKEKEIIEGLKRKIASLEAEGFISQNLEKINDVNFIFLELDKDLGYLRKLADEIRNKLSYSIVFFITSCEEKKRFVMAATSDVVKNKNFSCSDFILKNKETLSVKGGGKPNFCQGVIEVISDISSFKQKFKEVLGESLK